MKSALPERSEFVKALGKLDEWFQQDPTIERQTAIMLLEDQLGFVFVEADAVWQEWRKSRFGRTP